jgi:rhodanese-related sulfurtransferase
MKIRQRAVSLTLAAVLVGACSSDRGSIAGDRLVEVAQAAARGSDRVTVEELANWLVQGRGDLLLVDVRPRTDHAAGAIGEARNLGVAELLDKATLTSLPADRQIVVYSNGAEQAAKAATLLRLAGFNAKVLTGGYNAWHARVLNPDIPLAELDGEALQVSEQRALACYFVGDRGADSARRPVADFEPPVFEVGSEEAAALPPPPVGKESC